MEKTKRDDLTALARAAAAGPWCVHPNGSSVWQGDEYDSEGTGPQVIVAQVTLDEQGVNIAEFIAAANPAAVLELLESYGLSETEDERGQEDSEEVCSVCGAISDGGHTHRECYAAGISHGAFDENIHCAELLCEVLGVEYEGESFAEVCERVEQLQDDAGLLARAYRERHTSEKISAALERIERP